MEKGIPISPEHREALEKVAAELDVEAPFAAYEHTRFWALDAGGDLGY